MEANLPKHIAFIMDGNGRWAKQRNLPRNEGHRRGSETLRSIVKYADKIGIEYVTVYAFSTENWRRPQDEVDGLMGLMRTYLKDNIRRAKRDTIRFKVIGRREGLPSDIVERIEHLEQITVDKKGICVCIALNYGGRDELLRGYQKLIKDTVEGKLDVEEVTEDTISDYLDTAGIPDPDLMIRTSGELRISNFLPWQLAYSEFYFADCHWPEFDKKELDKALEVYVTRNRRFGKSE